MTSVLVFHSHGGGTGKTNFAVNVAAILALRGRRVCLMDTDVQAPGLHVLLGLAEADIAYALSDYLVGGCDIDDMIYDVSDRLGSGGPGRLTLVPSRLNAEVIEQVLGRGYDAGLLDELIRMLTERLEPDVLIIDTHSGMTNETMVAIGAADAVVIVMRPDEQDFRGAAVTTALTRRLNCPHTTLVLNMVSPGQDVAQLSALAEDAYGCHVSAVVPYSREIAETAGGSVFVLAHPDAAPVEGFSRITGHLAANVLGPPVAFS